MRSLTGSSRRSLLCSRPPASRAATASCRRDRRRSSRSPPRAHPRRRLSDSRRGRPAQARRPGRVPRSSQIARSAQLSDGARVVADEEDRPPLAPELGHRPRHRRWNSASPTASTSSTIDDVGLDVRRDREGEPEVHPGRVALERRVEEALDARELDDVVEAPRTSRRDMPRTTPFRKMFSRPVSSGWKPVPTSSSAPTRPRMRDDARSSGGRCARPSSGTSSCRRRCGR